MVAQKTIHNNWQHYCLIEGWQHYCLIEGWQHYCLIEGWLHYCLIEGWQHTLTNLKLWQFREEMQSVSTFLVHRYRVFIPVQFFVYNHTHIFISGNTLYSFAINSQWWLACALLLHMLCCRHGRWIQPNMYHQHIFEKHVPAVMLDWPTVTRVQGVQYRVYSTGCTVQGVQYRVYSTGCTVQGVQYMVYSTGCTVHGVQYRVYSTGCTVQGVQYRVYSTGGDNTSLRCARVRVFAGRWSTIHFDILWLISEKVKYP